MSEKYIKKTKKMFNPISKKEINVEYYELEAENHELHKIREKNEKEIERLKSIIGRSSDQINNIFKFAETTGYEERRLISIKTILLEVDK